MINIKYARKNYMKIDQIINEMTSSGSVASVSMPLGSTQKRAKESVDVKGLKPVSKLKNAKKKGPYANSIVENKEQVKVSEAELQEDDLIVIPGRGTKRKNGFVPKGQSRVDHEVEMARSDVLATMKNAKSIYHMLKNRSEEEGIEGWVQEKLIKANDYLNAVKEYYDEQMMQEMNGGVIAAGGVGEGVAEGRKDNEREREEANISHTRAKHMHPYFIITAQLGMGETKKFRVKAYDKEAAKEKFSQHHSSAKIIDIKQESFFEGVAESFSDSRLVNLPGGNRNRPLPSSRPWTDEEKKKHRELDDARIRAEKEKRKQQEKKQGVAASKDKSDKKS